MGHKCPWRGLSGLGSFLPLLISGCHEVSSFSSMQPCHNSVPCHKGNRSHQLRTETLESLRRNKPFSILFTLGICYSDGKLRNTLSLSVSPSCLYCSLCEDSALSAFELREWGKEEGKVLCEDTWEMKVLTLNINQLNFVFCFCGCKNSPSFFWW